MNFKAFYELSCNPFDKHSYKDLYDIMTSMLALR